MTAINAIATDDQGFILTDTVGYMEDGTIADWRQKAFPIAHLRAVVACRSYAMPQIAAFDACQDFDSFDDMCSQAPDWLTAVLKGQTEEEQRYGIDGVMMGWSGAQKKIRLAFYTSDNGFRLQFCPVAFVPLHSREEMAAAGVSNSQTIAPAEEMLKMMHLQRAPEGLIGGHAVLTIVKRDLIQQSVIHRWPDKRGEKILPSLALSAA